MLRKDKKRKPTTYREARVKHKCTPTTRTRTRTTMEARREVGGGHGDGD